MRLGVALLLLASTAGATVTVTAPRGFNCVRGVNDAAVCAREVSAGPVGAEGSTPVDWSGSFDGVWHLEPGAAGIPSGTNDGSCGTDCGLVSSAGSFSGPWAASIEGLGGMVGTAMRRTCADATCDELDGNGSASVSFGCMVWLADASATRTLVDNFATGSNGYTAYTDTNRKVICAIGASPDVVLTSGTAVTLNRWTAVGCSFSAIGSPFVEGTGTGAGALGVPAADSATFQLSVTTGSASWNGSLDLCWLRRNSLSTAQWCRVAMCGITGTEFGCTCQGSGTGLASYAQRGRYDIAGMTCTPSDCNAAAP